MNISEYQGFNILYISDLQRKQTDVHRAGQSSFKKRSFTGISLRFTIKMEQSAYIFHLQLHCDDTTEKDFLQKRKPFSCFIKINHRCRKSSHYKIDSFNITRFSWDLAECANCVLDWRLLVIQKLTQETVSMQVASAI